jgi:putative methyltransferase (TIGR04325 family)
MKRLRRLMVGLRRRLEYRRVLPVYERADQVPDEYQEEDVVSAVVKSTARYREELASTAILQLTDVDTRNLAAFSMVPNESLSVIDVGGACGALYFFVERMLPGRVGSWLVVETPAMADAARSHFQDDRLTFVDFDQFEKHARRCDLLIASGVIQYVTAPIELLEKLVSRGPNWLYLTRSQVSTSEATIMTHHVSHLSDHGPSRHVEGVEDRIVRNRLVLVPEREVLARIAKSYDIRMTFAESGEQSRRTEKGPITFRTIGMLAERHDAK